MNLLTTTEGGAERPLLRYHGGKWMLAEWILSFFPPHRIYVEPFGGAASVLLRKPRAFTEVYNDLDEDVVNLFRVLRDEEQSEELLRRLELTPFARREFLDSYIPTEDPVEHARRVIVRGMMAFGTTSRRKNMTGFRSSSYPRKRNSYADWSRYPDALVSVIERLKGVLVECQPAVDIVVRHDHVDTLFYVDPPYVLSTRTSVNKPSRADRCYAHDMDDEQHRELAVCLHAVKGMVVLSGYASDLYAELYQDWLRFDRKHYADGGKHRVESVWINPATMERLDCSMFNGEGANEEA